MWKKECGQFCREIHYKRKEEGIEITGCFGEDGQIVLPDEIEGLPVISIAPYVFAEAKTDPDDLILRNKEVPDIKVDRHAQGKAERICAEQVESVWLPKGVTEIGRYAFYRCRNLKTLILSDSLLEIGGGAFTGCRLEAVEIHFFQGEKSCLRSIVDEIRFAVRARLFYEGEEARVLFPEHYEEAVENTPARLLVTHHHGAGGYYRQCFYDRELDYKKYDELLYRTRAEEELGTAVELVMNRLCYPYRLEPAAKDRYKTFLQECLKEASGILAEQENQDGLVLLEREGLWTLEALEAAMERAAQSKKTEVLSLLMDMRYRCFPKKQKTFEL